MIMTMLFITQQVHTNKKQFVSTRYVEHHLITWVQFTNNELGYIQLNREFIKIRKNNSMVT